ENRERRLRASLQVLRMAICAEGSAALGREILLEDSRRAVMCIVAGPALHLAVLEWNYARAVNRARIRRSQNSGSAEPGRVVIGEVHWVGVGQVLNRVSGRDKVVARVG